MKNSFGCRNAKDWALLVLRIAVGVIFIYHGWGKLFGNMPGIPGFTGMLTSMHFPAPSAMAYLAALAEFIGGIAILLGIYAHIFALFTGFTMLVAFVFAHKFQLGMGDAALSLLACSIVIALMGAGRYSVMGMMCKDGEGCCANGCSCCGDKKMDSKK